MRALAVALGALAFAPLAGLLLRVASKGGYVAGGDGFLVLDQMQYLNWLRQSGSHLLIGNLYDLAPGPRTFLHPGLLVSGRAQRARASGATVAYMLWKPVAVLALWAGAVAWCRRFLPEGGRRVAAVALALFFASPLAALVGWSGWGGLDARFDFDFLSGELTTSNFVWGYYFTGIAVGLMPLGLLAHERGRTGLAAAAGLIVAWLQPWQGATYLLVIARGGAGWRGGGELAPRRALVAAAATAAPLALLLPALAARRRRGGWRARPTTSPIWPWWVTVIGLAPLALPALTGLRAAPDDLGGWMLRLWPVGGARRVRAAVRDLPRARAPGHDAAARHARLPRHRRDGGPGRRWPPRSRC